MDILLSERFRKMIKQSNLRITMSQLGEMTGVSPSQIRYWEKKGYINSEQGEKNQIISIQLVFFIGFVRLSFFLIRGIRLLSR